MSQALRVRSESLFNLELSYLWVDGQWCTWSAALACMLAVGATLSQGEKPLSTSLAHLDRSQSDKLIAEAMSVYKDCTDQAEECEEVGAVAMPENPHCFTFCFSRLTGCRSCCLESTCYSPPNLSEPSGTCGMCAIAPEISDRYLVNYNSSSVPTCVLLSCMAPRTHVCKLKKAKQ